jgi:hypothetical protein
VARERGYLGVVADDRQEHGKGVRITRVYPGTAAEKYGLRPQDLIIGLGGTRVEQMPPGGRLLFDILRGGQPLKVDVTFGRRPAGDTPVTAGIPEPPAPAPDLSAPASTRPAPPEPASTRPAPPAPAEPSKPPLIDIVPAGRSELAPSDRARLDTLERRMAELEQQIRQLRELLAEKKK